MKPRAQGDLGLVVELPLAGDQLDRVAGHDVLQDEQNQRDAEKDRDELQHALDDVLGHCDSPLLVSSRPRGRQPASLSDSAQAPQGRRRAERYARHRAPQVRRAAHTVKRAGRHEGRPARNG